MVGWKIDILGMQEEVHAGEHWELQTGNRKIEKLSVCKSTGNFKIFLLFLDQDFASFK